MKRILAAMTAALMVLALAGTAVAAAPTTKTVQVGVLEANWDSGVYSAYYGPPEYLAQSPGNTAVYIGRQAGLIKAGLTADPTGCAPASYCDEGLFAFKPAMKIAKFATSPLTYDVVNQYGTNPVWMTIEIDTGKVGDRTDNVTFQMVPAQYAPSNNYFTVDAGTATNWLQWADNNGTPTGVARTLTSIASDPLYAGKSVVRTYLRLGMGDSYGPGPNGTQAWVDKASIGGVIYDFIVGAQAPLPPGQNKIQCFDDDYLGSCTLVTNGAKGTAVLDIAAGGYAGVYVLNSNINLYAGQQTPLSAISKLSFTYTGTPTAGSPRISLPIDTNGDDVTDEWASISAYWCNNQAGLVDAINDPTCTIFLNSNGTTPVATSWAELVAAHPGWTVPFDNYVFIIADDAGLWTVSNVTLGKPGK